MKNYHIRAHRLPMKVRSPNLHLGLDLGLPAPLLVADELRVPLLLVLLDILHLFVKSIDGVLAEDGDGSTHRRGDVLQVLDVDFEACSNRQRQAVASRLDRVLHQAARTEGVQGELPVELLALDDGCASLQLRVLEGRLLLLLLLPLGLRVAPLGPTLLGRGHRRGGPRGRLELIQVWPRTFFFQKTMHFFH